MNKRFCILLLISLVLFILFFTLPKLYNIYQNSVEISPDEIHQKLQLKGFVVNNYQTLNEDNIGLSMPYTNYAIEFDLSYQNKIYRLSIGKFASVESALSGAQALNKFDKKMKGPFVYAFSFGDNIISISPYDTTNKYSYKLIGFILFLYLLF